MIQLSNNQLREIRNISYLKETQYRDLDINATLNYMVKRYIDPMKNHIDIRQSSLVDAGAGFGWLSFAFLLEGGEQATLSDIEEPRLKVAEEFAKILGVYDKCDFIYCPLQELELEENCCNIFVSIETLEHVGEHNIDKCIEIITKAAKDLVILTTPNKFFPMNIHDNKIPLSHLIPTSYRHYYTALFGLKKEDHPNEFVSPLRLKPLRDKFKPASVILTFDSYESWISSYPFYSPYGHSGRYKNRPPVYLKIIYKLLSIIFKRHTYLLSPNLCRIWTAK